MHTTAYIAASLDGFIARPDGNIDWLTEIDNPTNDDYGYAEFMKAIDAIVVGRGTFDTLLSFSLWPFGKPVFVLSSTLKKIPERLKGKATLLDMGPDEVIGFLFKEGFENIYIDGGKTIQGFLFHDLIDRIIITRIPILLGNGIPLFGMIGRELSFRHVETKIFPNGLVRSDYLRERAF